MPPLVTPPLQAWHIDTGLHVHALAELLPSPVPARSCVESALHGVITPVAGAKPLNPRRRLLRIGDCYAHFAQTSGGGQVTRRM